MMIVRTTVSAIILLFCINAFSQVADDFSDGDFTNGQLWSGDDAEFQIIGGQLNSLGPSASAELYLSTPNTLIDNTVWEFFIQINGSAPSGSNKVRVYLVSDITDLEGDVDGYYLEIGQSNDDFLNLKRSDAGSGTTILSGTTVFDNVVRVHVERSADGTWSLSADHAGGTSYVSEGSVVDNTYTSTAFFGFVVNHTSSRSDDYFFDDVLIDQVQVADLGVNSNTSIAVTFNQDLAQADAENAANYSISGITINAATKIGKTIALGFDPGTPLTTGNYQLEVGAGLTKNAAVTFDFSYLQLDLSSVLTLSSTELVLDFNDNLSAASAQTLLNYTVDNAVGNPSAAVLDGSDNSKVKLTFANPFSEGVTYELAASDIENVDQNSNFSGSANFDFVIPLVIQSSSVQSETELLVTFNKDLDQATTETTNNYSVDGGVGNPSSALLQADGQSVLLTFATAFQDADYTLTVSNVEDTDGNEVNVSGNTSSFSYLPMTIAGAEQVDYENIRVGFNQKVDDTSTTLLANYQIGEINPSAAVLDASDSSVVLTFSNLVNKSYALSISGVKNQSANSTLDAQVSIAFEKPTPYRDIIINELMPDPNPAVGQPVAEYVELYNRSDNDISIENFTLTGATISDVTILAKGYVLICSTSDYDSFFSGLSNAIGQSGFDALSNAGDEVILKDQFGNLIDSVAYDLSWYDSDLKDDGGYSLELINPNQPCSGDNNWTASSDATGGTPGLQNAVFSDAPDTTGPEVSDVNIDSPTSFSVLFNEPIEESSVMISSVSVPDNNVTAVEAQSLSEYKVTLESDLTSEVIYQIGFSGITDCAGNEIATDSYSFYYDITPPQFAELVVLSAQEIAIKFHEPINETEAERESNFALGVEEPDRALLQDSADYRVQLAFESEFVEGQTYIVSFENMKDALGNASTLQQVAFTYEDDVDTVYVVAPNILALRFEEKPTIASAQNVSNYQMEDIGSPIAVAIDEADSALVRLSFEENFDENNEVWVYLENFKNKSSNEVLVTPAAVFIYDTRAPDVIEWRVLDAKTLRLQWGEKINQNIASSSTRYTLEDGAHPQTVELVSDSAVVLTFASEFEVEKQKTISVLGVSDVYGNVFASSRKTNFVYDPIAPVLQKVIRSGEKTLRVSYHEKLLTDSLAKFTNFRLDGANPIDFSRQGPDSLDITLSFASIPDAEVSFLIQNQTDLYGNTAIDTTLSLNTAAPFISDVLAKTDSTVLVMFSEAMSSSIDDVANYSIEGQVLNTVDRVDDFSVEIRIDGHLQDGDPIALQTSNLTDQSDDLVQNVNVDLEFETFFDSYQVINSRTIDLVFETDFSSVSVANFYLDGDVAQLAVLDGDDQNVVRLFFSSPVDQVAKVLSWKELSDKYGRQLPAYSVNVEIDEEAPQLTQITSDFFSQLILTFSEELEEEAAESINLFSIVGIGYPAALDYDGDKTIVLDFNDRLTSDEEYQLVIDNLPDLQGNFLLDDTTTFTYLPPPLPVQREVLITEIMADPSPSIELPEAEYVELYNNGSRPINLKALWFYDESGSVSLPDYDLPAGDYVIIASTSNAGSFEISNAVGVSGFPALGNSGEFIAIRNVSGTWIDEVEYDSDWYADTEKDDGGYSLELINPESSCFGKANWTASISETGGTPGAQNSVYSLDPDADPPTVISYDILSTTTIQVNFSEPMDSLSLTISVLDSPGLNVSSVGVVGQYFEALRLTLGEALVVGKVYNVSLGNASDCSGNAMNDSTIQIGMGREPSFNELLITEVMADPDPVLKDLPNAEYIEIYNASSDLIALEGIRLSDATDTTELPAGMLGTHEYLILTSNSAAEAFSLLGSTIGVSNWPSLSNGGERLALMTADSILIDELIYDSDWYADTEKDDGGYSLELINPESSCFGKANWTASISETGGTPGAQNSVYSLDPDTDPPTVISYDIVSTTAIQVNFSEQMDDVSLVNGTVVASGLTVLMIATAGNDLESALITLSEALIPGEIYSMTLSNMSDCSGNVMDEATLQFGLGRTPSFNEILITEIMSDPDPVVKDLPNSEYLEIYNATDDLISLAGLMIADAGDTTSLSAQMMPAGSRLILCPNSAVEDFAAIGSTMGVSNWPSLSNSGEVLSLFVEEDLIFSVTYDQDWHDEEKASGGYSLEMKDVTNPCGDRLVWGSALSENGGTPGSANSNAESVPDNFGPNVIAAFVTGPNQVRLDFDENLNPFADETILISTTPSLTVTAVDFVSSTQLQMTLGADLEINLTYEVEVSNVTDCNGNEIREGAASFVRPGSADSLSLIINEILFDPKTGGVDFVEIYNNSDQFIDLKGWFLAREVDGALDQIHVIAESESIIAPAEYRVLTADPDELILHYTAGAYENFIGMASFPTYANDEGTAVLLDPDQNLIDKFTYSDDYHSSLLESLDGVSLERIDSNAPTQSPSNWISASSTVGFATPGYLNSQSFSAPQISGKLQAEPKVFVPGTVNAARSSFTTINYSFKEAGKFANVTVYDQSGRTVTELANGASLSTSGFMRWDGTNRSGQQVRSGYYLVVFEVYDGSGSKSVLKETVVVGWE
ncbi:MAG: lamin tail domain-containing protein [Cyclobacteriaceae bacterium]